MSVQQFLNACIPDLVAYRASLITRIRIACRRREKRTHLRRLLRDVTLTLMAAQLHAEGNR